MEIEEILRLILIEEINCKPSEFDDLPNSFNLKFAMIRAFNLGTNYNKDDKI